jgi:hypothetical protein
MLHLIFIGPESMANRDGEYPLPERTPENPFGGIVEDRLGGPVSVRHTLRPDEDQMQQGARVHVLQLQPDVAGESAASLRTDSVVR